MMEDDLYQMILQTSGSGAWKRFHLPFSMFTLTARGQMTMEQRRLDNLRLRSVGVLMTVPGEPFLVEIGSLRAVAHIDDTIIRNTVRDKVQLTDTEMDQLYPSEFCTMQCSGPCAALYWRPGLYCVLLGSYCN